MVETKSLQQTTANWNNAIGGVPEKYKQGVEQAQNVIQKSREAEEVWKAAVVEAAGRSARSKGLADVSDADWKKAASEKGSSRIGQGMRAASDKYQKGVSEVLSTIQGVSIPPRTIDPLANVDNRVKPIVQALSEMKRR